MKTWKDIAVSAVALMLIAGVTTAALAATNALTETTIAQRSAEAADTARRQVMDADGFAEVALGDTGADTVTCFRAEKDGKTVGYVFTAVTSGKSAGLTVMTGIDVNGTVLGVVVTEDNETAGYVDTVTKGGLLTAFRQRTAEQFKIGVNIDKVSNATKTSKGIVDAVNLACKWFDKIQKGEIAQ